MKKLRLIKTDIQISTLCELGFRREEKFNCEDARDIYQMVKIPLTLTLHLLSCTNNALNITLDCKKNIKIRIFLTPKNCFYVFCSNFEP